MSTISGPYSAVPLYPLYQAGQGSSAAGQTGAENNFQNNAATNQSSNATANPATGAQAGSLQGAQNAFQANSGTGASGSTAPVASTYTNPAPADSSDNPDASFINNQEAIADYQSMVLNLGQGNLAAAAKDYAQLQTDLNLHGQHRSGSVSANTSSSTTGKAGSVFSVTV